MEQQKWWEKGIIYQVYPRSFMDSNGDGVGDLPGIVGKLDYLREINIDAVWISPIYPSPMVDFGYDISNFTDVDPIFGTLSDVDRLVTEVHRRGMKLILDLVPNHTSDRHPWFLESRSSRDNPKRDWYIWADPAPGGGPPNNWLSEFGGIAWEYDEPTGQFYYHKYTKEQVDLNYRNPQVREALFDVMRFWLDLGVDGFRVDAAKNLIKDDQLRDNPPNPDYVPGRDPYESQIHIYNFDRPEVHDVIRQMREVIDQYDNRMMVGEIYLPLDRLVKYHGEDLEEFNLVYNFSLIGLPWEAQAVRQAVEDYENALPDGAWPNWVLGNHDRHRIASRVGLEQARVAQMLLLTLRGTPTCYYGDEIGMTDVEIPPDRVQDPVERNVPGLGLGRDPERSPMQWNDAPNAAFTAGEPWLPVSPDFPRVNVEVEESDPRSMLSLFRALTALRRSTPALSVGDYAAVGTGRSNVFAYSRRRGDDTLLVALNFGAGEERIDFSAAGRSGTVLLSTGLDRNGADDLGNLRLRPNEGIVLRPDRG